MIIEVKISSLLISNFSTLVTDRWDRRLVLMAFLKPLFYFGPGLRSLTKFTKHYSEPVGFPKITRRVQISCIGSCVSTGPPNDGKMIYYNYGLIPLFKILEQLITLVGCFFLSFTFDIYWSVPNQLFFIFLFYYCLNI